MTQRYGATLLALGWNRPRRIGGPGPETGFGFLNSSETIAEASRPNDTSLHHPICRQRVNLSTLRKQPAPGGFSLPSLAVAVRRYSRPRDSSQSKPSASEKHREENYSLCEDQESE